MIKRYYPALDPGGATGTPCRFGTDTNITGNSSFAQGTVNITGAAGNVVTIQVTTYTNSNTLGVLKVNGSAVFLNNTFNITLDGSGDGSFVYRIEGDASQTGTIVRGIFTMTAITIGQFGSPITKQESKIF